VSCVIAVNEFDAEATLPRTLSQHLSPREDGAPLCDDLKAAAHAGGTTKVIGKKLTTIANDDAIDIAPGKTVQYKFQVPVNNLNCKVEGRVRGLAGGNRDLAVYFFTDDQFVEFMQSTNGGSASDVSPKRDVQLDYQVYGAGTYYLVVSNRFSVVTTKVAQVKADVRCTKSPRPHIIE
jgi:hypothetical protein